MPDSFLHLGRQEQAQIYRALAPQLGRSAVVLEKDVWVCWVLRTLFTMPDRLPMVFKGGTSLSKVFRVIARFSEDVDITLDYRGWHAGFDPFAHGVSRSRLKAFSEQLTRFVRDHTHDVVAPHFSRTLSETCGADTLRLEVSDDGEQLRVHYPSALAEPGDYLGSSVLVEFGGRNITEPHEAHEVRPDIAAHVANLDFPCAAVAVLSPSRTFWEKATLIHVECQRGRVRASAARLSRHWYDLALLADHESGQTAVGDRALLEDVVRHKKAFFNASYANYDACLSGGFRLTPDDTSLAALRDDFQRMVAAGMFIGTPPDFDAIVDRLRRLEVTLNG